MEFKYNLIQFYRKGTCLEMRNNAFSTRSCLSSNPEPKSSEEFQIHVLLNVITGATGQSHLQ